MNWMSPATQIIQNSIERFKNERIEYIKYITPDEDSFIRRNGTVEVLKKIINKYYPNWSVSPYGSFKQNFCTSFSFVDITIYEEKKFILNEAFQLIKLRDILFYEGFRDDIDFI